MSDEQDRISPEFKQKLVELRQELGDVVDSLDKMKRAVDCLVSNDLWHVLFVRWEEGDD
jgi:hypothetical protein